MTDDPFEPQVGYVYRSMEKAEIAFWMVTAVTKTRVTFRHVLAAGLYGQTLSKKGLMASPLWHLLDHQGVYDALCAAPILDSSPDAKE